MKNITNTLFLKRAGNTVKKIRSISYAKLSDNDMKAKTEELKKRIQNGEKLDAILPEAFALVCEASRRVMNMDPFPVQIVGGIALHEGKIAELKTGEGKTLVATLPSYLNALTGKGVHVVTVNDYLANRDAETMGKIHEYLGLSVGCVLSNSTIDQKKKAYACDITYVTNTELGFDYLRDNMAQDISFTVLRGLEYAIIDEADSILIDEARTPLIISGEGTDHTALFVACNQLAAKMERGSIDKEFNKVDAILGGLAEETGDFIIHEKEKNITLTPSGVRKIEEFFRLEGYAAPQNIQIQHAMDQALRANYIMKKDKDYIVRDGQVLIVDTFTGRVMEGRQYSDGLHQAIQAKEHVPVLPETQTLATTSYQHFFKKYKKLSGMTGTAYTERKEFRQTYGLPVVVIPTNEPMVRKDHDDVVYLTKNGKMAGILSEVKRTHETGQPILIGTASVTSSEEVSKMLSEAGIHHQVLNAKQDKEEAMIISRAGKYGSVTVATNMAGRGTDIVLDELAKKAGGLKVIGTERHEARRIDNQLRGRSGRQGDPGESIFYLSLEDEMVRLFAPGNIRKILLKGGHDEMEPLSEKILTSAIQKSQEKVERNFFSARKELLSFDTVNDTQRELVYMERRKILEGENLQEAFQGCLESVIRQAASMGWGDGAPDEAERFFIDAFHLSSNDIMPHFRDIGKKASINMMRKLVQQQTTDYPYDHEVRDAFTRSVLLYAIDQAWMHQLQALEFLRQDIHYVSYSQADPKSVYAVEAFRLFDKMKEDIHQSAVYTFFHSVPVIRSVPKLKA